MRTIRLRDVQICVERVVTDAVESDGVGVRCSLVRIGKSSIETSPLAALRAASTRADQYSFINGFSVRD